MKMLRKRIPHPSPLSLSPQGRGEGEGVEGFTLLEVLVAIVIISIGLLAVAGMQTTAITANATSRDATIAIQLAEEMVDRIRVNGGDTPEIYDNLGTGNNCAGLTDTTAQGDCNQWDGRLDNSGLSGATGAVNVTINDPIDRTATITVTVTWGIVATRTVRFTTIMETWVT